MIPSPQLLMNAESIATVKFIFGGRVSHWHEMKNPILDSTLTVIIEPAELITGRDYSFCRNRHVWIQDVGPKEKRRATYLWKELMKLENQPSMIFTDVPQGLYTYNPITKEKRIYAES